MRRNKNFIKSIKEVGGQGLHQFEKWFDSSEDVEHSILKGYWDWSFHILTRAVCKYLDHPEKKTALEIGYGGGRIINAACNYFKKVIGIDIHDEKEMVEEFLKSQGKSNFKLIKGDGQMIDVKSESIDFIYSFIVLQHIASFKVLESYIKETYRCLKIGGIAQLYFGRYKVRGRLDRLRYDKIGYKKLKGASVIDISLMVENNKMRSLCIENGFKVIDLGASYKDVPNGYSKRVGKQNCITLLKEKT